MYSVNTRRELARRTLVLGLLGSVSAVTAQADGLRNGVAAGEVSQTSALLWAGTPHAGNVNFEVFTDAAMASLVGGGSVAANGVVPVKLGLSNLNSGVDYYYRATDALGDSSVGRFRTVDTAGSRNGLRFGVSGDWRGELAPYRSVSNVAARDLDFFVTLGDTIYGDVSSPALPGKNAETLAEYRIKHDEVYSSHLGHNSLADMRASTAWFATIDDHEVVNDFAGGASAASDPRFGNGSESYINETPRYQAGMQAFQEWNPIASTTYGATGDPRTAGKPNLYRQQSFGANAWMGVLDARSFRDQELADVTNPADLSEVGGFLISAFDPTRTMLGNQQFTDLKTDLLKAQNDRVTWKFVMVPEPVQNLGVLAAGDRYEGYAAERNALLSFIDVHNIENVVFVSADIHGTLVNNLTYQNAPFGVQIPSSAWEISTGSVAYDAPFGLTVAQLAFGLGLPGALDPVIFAGLAPAQKEAYVQGLINAQVIPLGYDALGLNGSSVLAQLLQGAYSASNSYGWTEFEIDPAGMLLVTTYGIDAYTRADLEADPLAILASTPRVMSQFRVAPVPLPPGVALLPAALVLSWFATRRSRSNIV